MNKEATEHQKIVHSQTTGLDNNTCPQCKSEGGQYLDIENKGESWTQTYCCYCRKYLNLPTEEDPEWKVLIATHTIEDAIEFMNTYSDFNLEHKTWLQKTIVY